MTTSWKFKILFPIFFVAALVIGKYILFNLPISTGKRVGNLVKLSKKGKIIKTWEGTIDEGSGDKLTTYFSIHDEVLGKELYEFEGKDKVIIYYEEYIVGWPYETNYNVTSWSSKENIIVNEEGEATTLLSKTLFCSLLGALYSNESLYKQVKEHLKNNNLYLYNQVEKCNE